MTDDGEDVCRQKVCANSERGAHLCVQVVFHLEWSCNRQGECAVSVRCRARRAEPDRQGETGTAKQAEPDRQSETGTARQAERDRHSHTDRARQAYPDRQRGTDRAGQPEPDRQRGTDRAGWTV